MKGLKMQAYKCDFCKKFYDGEEESGFKKDVIFNKKSLEVMITIQNQQSNEQYDICEDCMGGIMKTIIIEDVADDLKKEEK